jgi:hypothetical protein
LILSAATPLKAEKAIKLPLAQAFHLCPARATAAAPAIAALAAAVATSGLVTFRPGLLFKSLKKASEDIVFTFHHQTSLFSGHFQ